MLNHTLGIQFVPRPMRVRPSSLVAVALIAAVMAAAALYEARSPAAGLAALVAGAACAWLIIVPPFWTAAILIAGIPFHQLISALLSDQGGNGSQIAAPWVVLLLIGIVQALNNSNARGVVVANRAVLVWTGLLLLAYAAAFVWNPGIPALSGMSLGTRYLAVMLFFMLLRLDEVRAASLLRLMLWSAALISAYGLVQYFWDYDRLLPFLASDAKWGLFFDDERRIYSYSFNAFEPAYTAVIGILILFSRSLRVRPAKALCWVAIFLPCLLLTYTRSGYIALPIGIAVICARNRVQFRQAAVIGSVVLSLAIGALLSGGGALGRSSLGQRLGSIVSQNDLSSAGHKESILHAIRDIPDNPFGIGLGKSGMSTARYQGADNARYIENWPLQVAADTGVFGAIAFIGLTGAVLWSLRRGQAGPLAPAAVSIFAAMTVASVMAPVWFCEATCVYTWAIVGMALGARNCAGYSAVSPAASIQNGSELFI